jgi:hypothetical protein
MTSEVFATSEVSECSFQMAGVSGTNSVPSLVATRQLENVRMSERFSMSFQIASLR